LRPSLWQIPDFRAVVDINMPRDKLTNKPRGFAFLMYEDQRSTVLAVDNLTGAKVLERTLRVDHGAS
jgi:RNA-binding motif X-linked protein 2